MNVPGQGMGIGHGPNTMAGMMMYPPQHGMHPGHQMGHPDLYYPQGFLPYQMFAKHPGGMPGMGNPYHH